MIVGIKYCGGCNPRFDRTELVAALVREFPQHSFAVAGATSGIMDLLLVACGCRVACADVSGYGSCRSILWIRDAADMLLAREVLNNDYIRE